jgi:biopolymer transport protein ExbB/TolQ
MFSSVTTYVIAGLVIVIMIMGGLSYWYFTYSQEQIGILRENAAKLEQAVQTQTETIRAQQAAHERTNREVVNLQTRLGVAESNRRETESRLRRANLEAQARTSRIQTEQRINQDIQDAFTQFERITGATTPSVRPNTPTPSISPSVNSNRSDPQPAPRPPIRSVTP